MPILLAVNSTGKMYFPPVPVRAWEIGLAKRVWPSRSASAHSFSTVALNLIGWCLLTGFPLLSATASIYVRSTWMQVPKNRPVTKRIKKRPHHILFAEGNSTMTRVSERTLPREVRIPPKRTITCKRRLMAGEEESARRSLLLLNSRPCLDLPLLAFPSRNEFPALEFFLHRKTFYVNKTACTHKATPQFQFRFFHIFL